MMKQYIQQLALGHCIQLWESNNSNVVNFTMSSEELSIFPIQTLGEYHHLFQPLYHELQVPSGSWLRSAYDINQHCISMHLNVKIHPSC